jgi:hypothetical protein
MLSLFKSCRLLKSNVFIAFVRPLLILGTDNSKTAVLDGYFAFEYLDVFGRAGRQDNLLGDGFFGERLID